MNPGQAILFTAIGGLIALLVAGIVAAVIASALRRSTQRQLDSQLKAQKDLYEEQVRTLKISLQEQQEQQRDALTTLLSQRPPEAPVIVPAAPVVSENGPART